MVAALAALILPTTAGCSTSGSGAQVPVPVPQIEYSYVKTYRTMDSLAEDSAELVVFKPTSTESVGAGTEDDPSVQLIHGIVDRVVSGSDLKPGQEIVILDNVGPDNSGKPILSRGRFTLFLVPHVLGPGLVSKWGAWVPVGGQQGALFERSPGVFTKISRNTDLPDFDLKKDHPKVKRTKTEVIKQGG